MQAMCTKRDEQQGMEKLGAAAAVAAALLLVSFEVHAGGSGMPWESTLDSILQSLQGPVARFAGILAIVLTGLMFALGEGGQMFKRGLGIAFGLSIAFSASTFIGQLGFAGGALL